MDAPQPITLESMPGTLQLWTGLKTTWHVMVVLHPHPHQALVDLRNGKEMVIAMMKTTLQDVIMMVEIVVEEVLFFVLYVNASKWLVDK